MWTLSIVFVRGPIVRLTINICCTRSAFPALEMHAPDKSIVFGRCEPFCAATKTGSVGSTIFEFGSNQINPLQSNFFKFGSVEVSHPPHLSRKAPIWGQNFQMIQFRNRVASAMLPHKLQNTILCTMVTVGF